MTLPHLAQEVPGAPLAVGNGLLTWQVAVVAHQGMAKACADWWPRAGWRKLGKETTLGLFGRKSLAGSRNMPWPREKESANSAPPIRPQHSQHMATHNHPSNRSSSSSSHNNNNCNQQRQRQQAEATKQQQKQQQE